MHKRPVTWTGRGLRLAYVGDIVLAVTAAIYFLNYSGRLAAFGFFVAGAIGLFSIQRMWTGRNEFGLPHAKNVKRGLILFFVGSFLFFYAFIAGLTTVPETLRMRDLRPPVLATGLAIGFEAASGALLLRELVGSRRKALPLAYAVVGTLLGVFVLVTGMMLVAAYEAARLPTQEIAQQRLLMFVAEFLPYVMATFLVTRLFVLYLLRTARKEVETAEHDSMAEAETPAPLPPEHQPNA